MTEYEDNPDFKIAIEKMLANTKLTQLNPLREYEGLCIFSLLSVRTDNDGEYVAGKGTPITCRRMTPPVQVLTGGHYLLIADYYYWMHADPKDQVCKLYHALMHINITKNEEGVFKLGLRKPDVLAFSSEIALFGPHTPQLVDMKTAFEFSAREFAESFK